MEPAVLSKVQELPPELLGQVLAALLFHYASPLSQQFIRHNFSLVCRSFFLASLSNSYAVSSSAQAEALALRFLGEQLARAQAKENNDNSEISVAAPESKVNKLWLNTLGESYSQRSRQSLRRDGWVYKFKELLERPECDELQHLALDVNHASSDTPYQQFLSSFEPAWWTTRFQSLNSLNLNLRGIISSSELIPLVLLPSLTSLTLAIETVLWKSSSPDCLALPPIFLKSLRITFGSCSISSLSYHSQLLSSFLNSTKLTLTHLNLHGLRFWNLDDVTSLLPSLLQVAPSLLHFSASFGAPPSPDSKKSFQRALSMFFLALTEVRTVELGWDAGHSLLEFDALAKLSKLRILRLDGFTHSAGELEAMQSMVIRGGAMSLRKLGLRCEVSVAFLREDGQRVGVLVDLEC